MKKKMLFPLLALFLMTNVFADEGMWLLPLVQKQNQTMMKERGLKLESEDIYSPTQSALKDAVVMFGSGCTGEVISPEGLILTNHHCGYSYIQNNSSVEHDYLTDGFWAMTREQELPNPGLKVTFIDQMEDVTDFVKAELKKDTVPNSMNYLSPSYLNKLAKIKAAKILESTPGTEAIIKPLYGGNVYYLYIHKVYTDIRMVGAPPSSVGKFGADTDNWMWPRHTGDFSLFRVYADKEGNPAKYSKENIPLCPKKFFNISLKGVQVNDFAMLMGFPGKTNRFYTASEVSERRDIENTIRVKVRDVRQKVMLAEMLDDPKVRIQYASKYASSTNSFKSSQGMNLMIKLQQLEQLKRNQQQELIAYEKANNLTGYSQAIYAIDSLVKKRASLRIQQMYLIEGLQRAIEFSSVPHKLDSLRLALKNKDKTEIKKQLDKLEKKYMEFADKDYNREVDKKVSKAILWLYANDIEAKNRPAFFSVINSRFKGNIDLYIDESFKTSIFASKENFDKFKMKPSLKTLDSDLMLNFAESVAQESELLKNKLAEFNNPLEKAQYTYIGGLLKMNKGKPYYPDANLTLRLTYGSIDGLSPKEAVHYEHQTTMDGIIEKENSDNWEFVVDKKLKALYNAKDFGHYALSDGRMPVAFIANTHTTGGNSGSPVLNAEGELIGTGFDRNWEGISGDIQYQKKYQRTICVDIRYTLFIIEKLGEAKHLIDEMVIKK